MDFHPSYSNLGLIASEATRCYCCSEITELHPDILPRDVAQPTVICVSIIQIELRLPCIPQEIFARPAFKYPPSSVIPVVNPIRPPSYTLTVIAPPPGGFSSTPSGEVLCGFLLSGHADSRHILVRDPQLGGVHIVPPCA